jgi:tRNA U54 and U55 pseudouridine synthase Pus10
MNWCKIIGHKWNYYEEKHVSKNRHLHRPNSIIKLDVRLCKRCFKKQMTKLGSGVYNFKLGKYCNWKEMKLTKSEEREKKYKELGL